MRFDNAQFHKV